jgi:hypothetical protein
MDKHRNLILIIIIIFNFRQVTPWGLYGRLLCHPCSSGENSGDMAVDTSALDTLHHHRSSSLKCTARVPHLSFAERRWDHSPHTRNPPEPHELVTTTVYSMAGVLKAHQDNITKCLNELLTPLYATEVVSATTGRTPQEFARVASGTIPTKERRVHAEKEYCAMCSCPCVQPAFWLSCLCNCCWGRALHAPPQLQYRHLRWMYLPTRETLVSGRSSKPCWILFPSRKGLTVRNLAPPNRAKCGVGSVSVVMIGTLSWTPGNSLPCMAVGTSLLRRKGSKCGRGLPFSCLSNCHWWHVCGTHNDALCAFLIEMHFPHAYGFPNPIIN